MFPCCDECWPDYPTLSLERWRDLLCCLDPYEFWQWRARSSTKGSCDALTIQHQWGRKFLGRSEVTRAIAQAEQLFDQRMGFPALPTELSEYIHLPRSIRLMDHDCERLILRTKRSHLISLGRPKRVLLGVVTVTYADLFSGLRDTFTASLAGVAGGTYGAVAADQIEIYFADSDRFDVGAPLARWRIDPVHTTVTAGVLPDTYDLALEGPSWLMAVPKLYERRAPFAPPITTQPSSYALDPEYDPNYVTQIAVYRKVVEPCTEGRAVYEKKVCTCGATVDCAECDTCENVQLCLVDPLRGMFRVVAKEQSICTCRRITAICVDYVAGDCTFDWSKVIVALSCAEMAGCCICDCSYSCLEEYTRDLGVASAKDERTVTFEQLNGMFGTKGGHLYAAERIAAVLAMRPSVSSW